MGGVVDLVPRPSDLAEVVEDADTLEGNARLKAIAVCVATELPALADDTGLEVSALNGAPGVHSARYAGAQRSDQDNMDKLLQALEGQADRSAQFKTVITYCDGDQALQFTGIVKGSIGMQKNGTEGFGYDPLFIPEEVGKTFAQMTLAEKNQYSHRARATAQFLEFLQEKAAL